MRKVHRWLSLLACLFLLVVGVTGVILQVQSLTSADEAERERLAEKPSPFIVGASLDKPRAAADSLIAHAAKQLGDKAGIDWIEYRLRADPPRVVLHALRADGSPVRFVGKIDDGSIIGPIIGEPDPRESLILRLHTGEVLGDGGVVGGILWGSALVVLTLTGMWMYYRMWKARRRSLGAAVERGAPGAKKPRFGGIVWMLAVGVGVCGFTRQSHAGPPFLTDDPWFADKGWELKSKLQYERHEQGPDVLVGPTLDINYTFVPGFKLNVTFAPLTLYGKNGAPTESGLTDTDFKFKWRFMEEDPDGWRPALGTAPTIKFPTGDEGRGLTDGTYMFKIPLLIGKTFGEDHTWFTYAETTFAKKLNGSGGSGETLIFGAVLGRNVTDHLQLGVELYHEFALNGSASHSQILNFGATYAFDEHWNIQLGVGKSISANDGPDPIVQFLVQRNF